MIDCTVISFFFVFIIVCVSISAHRFLVTYGTGGIEAGTLISATSDPPLSRETDQARNSACSGNHELNIDGKNNTNQVDLYRTTW